MFMMLIKCALITALVIFTLCICVIIVTMACEFVSIYKVRRKVQKGYVYVEAAEYNRLVTKAMRSERK